MAELRRIIVSMPAGLLDEFDVFVKKEGRNRSDVVREAMRLFLESETRRELRSQLREGYASMSALSLDSAHECAAAEEEAFQTYERFIAGVVGD